MLIEYYEKASGSKRKCFDLSVVKIKLTGEKNVL